MRHQDPFRGIRAASSGDTNCHLDRLPVKVTLVLVPNADGESCGDEMSNFRLAPCLSKAAQPWRFMTFGYTGNLERRRERLVAKRSRFRLSRQNVPTRFERRPF